MRIAILSDVHSNFEALVQAVAFMDESRIDELYCLGDIIGYGASPNECVALIRERAVHCVLGNHDLAAVEPSHAEFLNAPGKIAALWTNKVLTRENAEFLSNLPYTIENEQVTLVHASPAQPHQWQYILSLEDARPQLEYFHTPICFVGHTHVPSVCGEDLKTFTLNKQLKFLINVGSVGQPRDGDPRSSFGILDTEAWTYENIRVEYDVPGAAKKIIAAKLPKVLAERLSHGI